MACEMLGLFLALEIANGYIPPDTIIVRSTGGSWSSSSAVINTATTGTTTASVLGRFSPADEIEYHRRAIAKLEEELAAERRRKKDLAYIDATLKECKSLKK